MAVKYQYLVDPLLGFQTKSGSLNTAGIIRVFDAATDDPVVTYKDFAGTENSQDIRLDDNGRAVIIADDSRAYRIDVCDRYGALLYNQTPMYAKGGGGGVMTNVTITSEDGTVNVETTSEGGVKNFDLSVKHDDPEFIVTNSWYVKGDGSSNHCGYIVPQNRVQGNMDIDWQGILLKGGNHYHVDAWIDAKADNDQSDPGNEYRTRDMLLNFRLLSENGTPVNMEFDNSFPHKDSYNLSGDLHPSTDTYLKVYFDNYDWANYQSGYITASHLELPRLSVHSIVGNYYGSGGGGGGGGGLDQVYHDSTLLGDGTQLNPLTLAPITINQLDPNLRPLIGAQSDWTETDDTSPAFILHKPDLSDFATQQDLAGKQDTLIPGANITIQNNIISSTAEAQVQSDWTEIDSNDPAFIKHKPDMSQYATTTDLNGKADKVSGAVTGNLAGLDSTGNLTDSGVSSANIVHDPNYVHTDNNFTNVYVTKINNIEDGAEANVIEKVKLAGTDLPVSSYDKSVNIPLAVATGLTGATDGVISANDKQKLDGIESGAEQNVQANWNESDPLSDAFILNKPQNLVQDASYVHTDNNFTTAEKNKLSGIEAGAQANVQSDWNESDPLSDAFILNKPASLANKQLVAGTNITLTQSATEVTISATNVTSTYDTQSISAGAHILISSDARISTDLTESGELLAHVTYQADYGSNPPNAAGSSGMSFTQYSELVNYTATELYDPTGLFSGAFDPLRLLTGGTTSDFQMRDLCFYTIHFDIGGVLTPTTGDVMMLELTEYGQNPPRYWATDYSTTAKNLSLHCSLISSQAGVYPALAPFKIYNAAAGARSLLANAMYPSLTVTVRHL